MQKNQKNDKINSLTEDPDSIEMAADINCKVKFFHSCKKFGSTRTNPIVKMACLVGHGARALPVVIGSDKITDFINVNVPLDERIWTCKTIEELKDLETETIKTKNPCPPPEANGVRTRNQIVRWGEAATAVDTEAEKGEGNPLTQSYKKLMSILPIPFLTMTAFDSLSWDPLYLVLIVKNAAITFNTSHSSNEEFKYKEAIIPAKKMMK